MSTLQTSSRASTEPSVASPSREPTQSALDTAGVGGDLRAAGARERAAPESGFDPLACAGGPDSVTSYLSAVHRRFGSIDGAAALTLPDVIRQEILWMEASLDAPPDRRVRAPELAERNLFLAASPEERRELIAALRGELGRVSGGPAAGGFAPNDAVRAAWRSVENLWATGHEVGAGSSAAAESAGRQTSGGLRTFRLEPE